MGGSDHYDHQLRLDHYDHQLRLDMEISILMQQTIGSFLSLHREN